MIVLIIKLLSLITICRSAKILAVFPSPFISHHYVFRPFIQELARRGHQVTVVTPNPASEGNMLKNLEEINLHEVTYNHMNNFTLELTGKAEDIYAQADKLFDLFADVFEEQIKTSEVQNLVNSKREFDLLIIEACVRPALVFGEIFKAPIITISSLGSLDMFTEYLGVPTHPILYPTNLHQRLHRLSFWERAKEIYKHYYLEGMLKDKEVRENEMLRRHFGDSVPALNELKKNIAVLLMNLHSVWEENRPVPPNVIYLGGGLHLERRKHDTNKLDNDLESYLNSSINGVIYMSLGTNVKPSELPKETRETMLLAFSQLPYDFLVRWDKDYLECPHNVKIVKWVPQLEVLKHPKVKLFITQGGLQSTDEAIAAGVPLIGIPFLGDQWYNTDQYEYLKIGLKMDTELLTNDKLTNAIVKVIEDISYRQNIKTLRTVVTDQPQSPLDKAIWWAEYVIRHKGAPHLQSSGAHMIWTEFLELDLVFIGITCAVSLFTTAVYLGLYVMKKLNNLHHLL